MVHLHYVLWKADAPRFDERAEALLSQAAALRKAGCIAHAPSTCKIDDVVEFFGKYITEWNLNKTSDGSEVKSHVAERVNEAVRHPASLSSKEMLELLRDENKERRLEHYKLAVRVEQMHDFHYPDPIGPPNPSQPCATLLKGTRNMWHCKNGCPWDLVCECCHQSVAQDALRPELWRVCLLRNCPLMNSHMPVTTLGCQSNTDGSGVLTQSQATMYLCKYCTKHLKRCGQRNVLYEVIDDMTRMDESAKEKYGEGFERSKLGSKLHRAFMAEVGEEMSQAEVAHHTLKCPEYLCSRPQKHVSFYKKALALNVPKESKSNKRKTVGGNADQTHEKLGTKPSDLELYERRGWYTFASGSSILSDLPHRATPEEQVLDLCAWDFFRLVTLKGGQNPFLEWYDPASRPIVLISPAVSLAIGADFAFGARWALLQYHPWTDRRWFLDMESKEVKKYFDQWLSMPICPWYIIEQYLAENGLQKRAGAGCSSAKRAAAPGSTAACEETADDSAESLRDDPVSDSEASSADEVEAEASRETHVLKMLYKGNVAEVDRREEQTRKAKVYNRKHDYYRNTRCTDVAQEEHSALPAGVFNVNEDSDDEDAYGGEQKEISKELDELRAAQQWINQEGWDVNQEGRAFSKTLGKEVDLRLDWGEVKKRLDEGAETDVQAATARLDRDTVLKEYSLDRLDPTQRAFADRMLRWIEGVIDVYTKVRLTGVQQRMPRLRTWLAGSAGSGKSWTLKTVVYLSLIHI